MDSTYKNSVHALNHTSHTCYYHPERPQTDKCHMCGRALCDECVRNNSSLKHQSDYCPNCFIDYQKNSITISTCSLGFFVLIFAISFLKYPSNNNGVLFGLIFFLSIIIFGNGGAIYQIIQTKKYLKPFV